MKRVYCVAWSLLAVICLLLVEPTLHLGMPASTGSTVIESQRIKVYDTASILATTWGIQVEKRKRDVFLAQERLELNPEIDVVSSNGHVVCAYGVAWAATSIGTSISVHGIFLLDNKHTVETTFSQGNTTTYAQTTMCVSGLIGEAWIMAVSARNAEGVSDLATVRAPTP